MPSLLWQVLSQEGEGAGGAGPSQKVQGTAGGVSFLLGGGKGVRAGLGREGNVEVRWYDRDMDRFNVDG